MTTPAPSAAKMAAMMMATRTTPLLAPVAAAFTTPSAPLSQAQAQAQAQANDPDYETMKYMIQQMKIMIAKARETKTANGRATDDKRAFVECIVLGITDDSVDETEFENDDDTNMDTKPAATTSTTPSATTTQSESES